MIAVPAEWETLYAKYFHIPVTDLIQYPNPYFALPLYTAVAVYIALIFGIPVVFRKMGWKGLQNNEAFRILLIIWNGCLSIFSLAAFLGSTIPYAQFVQKYGFMNILCDESGILLNYRETGMYILLYAKKKLTIFRYFCLGLDILLEQVSWIVWHAVFGFEKTRTQRYIYTIFIILFF